MFGKNNGPLGVWTPRRRVMGRRERQELEPIDENNDNNEDGNIDVDTKEQQEHAVRVKALIWKC